MGKKSQKTNQFDEVIDENVIETYKFTMIAEFVRSDPRITDGQYRIYDKLKSYAYHGSCFPGIKTLAKELDTSERTISGHLGGLEKLGLIKRKRRPNKTNIYRISKMSEVYFEGADLMRLKKWFYDSLVERDMLSRFRQNNIDFTHQEKEQERAEPKKKAKVDKSKVEEKLAEQRKKRGKQLLGNLGDVEEKAEKARQNAERNRKMKKRGKLKVVPDNDAPEKPLNTNDVEAVWRDMAREHWPKMQVVGAKWGLKEKGIIKRLIEKHGVGTVIRGVDYSLKNWKYLMTKFKLKPIPEVQSVAFFANVWFPYIEEGLDPIPNTKRSRALSQGEYTDGNAEESGISFFGD